MKTQKALVTGGSGFIGRWVVARLIDAGMSVTVLDDLSNSSLDNLSDLPASSLKFERGDVRDARTVDRLLEEGVDVCFHLAAHIRVHDSLLAPRDSLQTETIGSFNILEACRRHESRLVFVSTCMVYDSAQPATTVGIAERDPVLPRSPYAAAKLGAEQFVLAYHHAYGLPVTVLRPFNTYGPYQRDDGEGGVIATFLRRQLEGRDLEIYGDGRQTRDFLYVGDCAAGIVAAGIRPEAIGQLLNLSSGRDVSVNELAALICPDAGKVHHVRHIHPEAEIPKLLGNSDRAVQVLDWRPAVALEDGVNRTREWMLNHALVHNRG